MTLFLGIFHDLNKFFVNFTYFNNISLSKIAVIYTIGFLSLNIFKNILKKLFRYLPFKDGRPTSATASLMKNVYDLFPSSY